MCTNVCSDGDFLSVAFISIQSMWSVAFFNWASTYKSRNYTYCVGNTHNIEMIFMYMYMFYSIHKTACWSWLNALKIEDPTSKIVRSIPEEITLDMAGYTLDYTAGVWLPQDKLIYSFRTTILTFRLRLPRVSVWSWVWHLFLIELCRIG